MDINKMNDLDVNREGNTEPVTTTEPASESLAPIGKERIQAIVQKLTALGEQSEQLDHILGHSGSDVSLVLEDTGLGFNNSISEEAALKFAEGSFTVSELMSVIFMKASTQSVRMYGITDELALRDDLLREVLPSEAIPLFNLPLKTLRNLNHIDRAIDTELVNNTPSTQEPQTIQAIKKFVEWADLKTYQTSIRNAEDNHIAMNAYSFSLGMRTNLPGWRFRFFVEVIPDVKRISISDELLFQGSRGHVYQNTPIQMPREVK